MNIVSSFCRSEFDMRVRDLQMDLLKSFAERDIPVDIAVAAVADLIAALAATQDAVNGNYSFPEKMDSFCQRAEETYQRLHELATTPKA